MHGTELDLEKKTPRQKALAEKAIGDEKMLTDILNGLLSKKCSERYENFKIVHLISEQNPGFLYHRWAFFEDLLNSANNSLKFYAIHILANLVRVDENRQFERVFDRYYGILEEDALVPACHVAYVSGRIVNANPDLMNRITERLLSIDRSKQRHKDIIKAKAIESFSEYFDRSQDKEKILKFAKDLQSSESPLARKNAKNFLDKWINHPNV